MNSPPSSSFISSSSSAQQDPGPSDPEAWRLHNSNNIHFNTSHSAPNVSHSLDKFNFTSDITMTDNTAGPSRPGPPSPPSTGSAIAVGSVSDADLIKCIEQGEFSGGAGDDETRSLTESIRQHIVDGGLRYHAYHAGKYAFPNDETEQFRDDLKHNLTVYLCDGDFFYAPVRHLLEDGAEVLDLGTGTGKWCIDLADSFPKSTFHGMDLSPIQPDWIPENVSFVVDDIEHEAGWTYPENHFDFIHMRHTLHSIQDREELWKRIYAHLKPGGWFEIQEFHYAAACDDNSCDGPYAWRDFIRYLEQGMAALGSDLHGILRSQQELNDAGFTDVRGKSLKCPVGPWAKRPKLQECGHILRDVIMWGLNGIARRPFRDGLNWTNLQIEMFLVDVRKSILEEVNGLPKFHSYYPFYSVYGRKPLNPPNPSTTS